MSECSKTRIRADEIKAGKPLPWAIYDETGTLLLNAGNVPASESQVKSLIARGLYRKEGPSPRPSASETKKQPPEEPEGPPGGLIPFEDLALQPGAILQIHSALEVAGDFMPSVLLGYFKNQTIIVTNPIVGGKLVAIKENDPYQVKAFSGTNLFSFRAKVLKAYPAPYAHLHLEYPKLVHTTKIRKSLRSPVNLPAELRDPATGDIFQVLVKDLSVGGAKLMLPQLLGEKEAKYELSFKIKLAEDLEEEVRAPVIARAVDSQTVKGAPAHTMGVQFQDLGKEARLLVMTLVYRQQLGKD